MVRFRILMVVATLIWAGLLPGVVQAAEENLPPPRVGARAAIVIDADTGRVLYEQNAHERLPPASLTKMATALVALERARPDFMVVATERSLVEPVVIGLEPGDQLPLREALYGLLLNSGNDVALAIAESVGEGSITRFVGWMNELVAALGLQDTRFANPHGLDVGEHYSSAYDLAVIGRVLLRNPLLRSIVATRDHTYQGSSLWAFHNINRILQAYPGADGIKTGYEIRAGYCMAASATRDGRQLVSVVLNSAQTVQDSSTLLDYGFAVLAHGRDRVLQESLPSPGRVERALARDRNLQSSGGLDAGYVIDLLTPRSRARLGGPPNAGDSIYDRLRSEQARAGSR